MTDKTRFAWNAVSLFAMSSACVLTLNLLQKHSLIDKETEGLLRLTTNGCLSAIVVVKSLQTPLLRSLRVALMITITAILAETLLDYTEDVPALANAPLVGHNSPSRRTIEPILAAGWMCGGFAIIYIAMHSIDRWRREATQQIDKLRRSEQNLSLSNQNLSSALEELQLAQQQLVQRERLSALGQMASGVAHDLNNTLTPVVNYTHLLSRHADFSDEQGSWLESIERSALDAVATIQGLQQFYRRDADSCERRATRLDRLVQQVIQMTRPRWKDEPERDGCQIHVETDFSECAPVYVNPAEFRSALTNLIFNAVEAMPGGGTIRLSLREKGNRVVLTVVDSGVGMSEEAMKRCFEPFYSTKSRGSGLGLSVCHGIIDRAGGSLEVKSTQDGTTFVVKLPVASDLTNSRSPAVRDRDRLPTSLRRVLLVDDDDVVRQSVRELLAKEGMEVVCAGSGSTGIGIWRNQGPFDLIITDLGMPGMDGAGFVRSIRETHPDQLIGVISGWTPEEVRSHFATDEMPGVIFYKPRIAEELQDFFRRGQIPHAGLA